VEPKGILGGEPLARDLDTFIHGVVRVYRRASTIDGEDVSLGIVGVQVESVVDYVACGIIGKLG
jgi:hypothetical protein